MISIKQHWKIIAICLLSLLFLFKSCQSCSRKQEIDFYRYDSGKLIDSLRDINRIQSDSITNLNHNIDLLQNQLINCENDNKKLQEDKQHLRRINSKLIENSN